MGRRPGLVAPCHRALERGLAHDCSRYVFWDGDRRGVRVDGAGRGGGGQGRHSVLQCVCLCKRHWREDDSERASRQLFRALWALVFTAGPNLLVGCMLVACCLHVDCMLFAGCMLRVGTVTCCIVWQQWADSGSESLIRDPSN